MKFIVRIAIFAILAITLLAPIRQHAGAAEAPENNSGAVLCPPAIYLETPQDCVPLGPSAYLTEMARLGIELPIRPLDISHPDPALGELPYKYYKINPSGTSFYPTLESAREKIGASFTLPPTEGLLYVVYTERQDYPKGGTYFLLPSGVYMPGDGETMTPSFTDPAHFPGVEVHTQPKNPFGWVFRPTGVRREPNLMFYNEPVRTLNRYEIVQIFSTEVVEGTKWYLIGPEEWVTAYDVAAVTPNSTPPEGVTNGRWIDVNLAEQTLAVYENSTMVYATIVATGDKPLYTRPGLFPIYKKLELETMQGERGTSSFYHLENVPWTMYFDKARALHGAYWRAVMGYPQSHGCVNMYPGDAHWVFNWAKEGDWVYVHDPSGQTPTDPAYYGDGGA